MCPPRGGKADVRNPRNITHAWSPSRGPHHAPVSASSAPPTPTPLPQDYAIECPSTGSLFSLKDGSIQAWYPNNPVLRTLTPSQFCRPLEVRNRETARQGEGEREAEGGRGDEAEGGRGDEAEGGRGDEAEGGRADEAEGHGETEPVAGVGVHGPDQAKETGRGGEDRGQGDRVQREGDWGGAGQGRGQMVWHGQRCGGDAEDGR